MNVTVLPAAASFAASPGTSLLEAAMAAAWRWPSVCGGLAECGTCAIQVEQGAELLTAMTPAEEARLASLPLRAMRPEVHWRLACQARAARSGTLIVRRAGARPPAAAQP